MTCAGGCCGGDMTCAGSCCCLTKTYTVITTGQRAQAAGARQVHLGDQVPGLRAAAARQRRRRPRRRPRRWRPRRWPRPWPRVALLTAGAIRNCRAIFPVLLSPSCSCIIGPYVWLSSRECEESVRLRLGQGQVGLTSSYFDVSKRAMVKRCRRSIIVSVFWLASAV